MTDDHTPPDRSESERGPSVIESKVVPSLVALRANDAVWLAMALAVAVAVVAAYYAAHPYPAFGAGLYLSMSEGIAANGYRPPARIPGYTAGGVPFVYPPLAFYGIAVLLDLGADPITLTRTLPGLLSVVAVIPFYYLAREVLGTPFRAGVATVPLATSPVVLQWHISAGGAVRSLAFLLTLIGLYCGVRLFRYRDRRWFVPGTVLFGLTVLTHPTYTIFFAASYLLMYAFFDRSLTGLLAGGVVAAGGFVIALPWLAHVASTHGVETLTAAAGTHGGIGRRMIPERLMAELGRPIAAGRTRGVGYLLAVLGSGYFIARRRFFLPAWFLLAVALLHERRFAFVPGAMIIGGWMTAPLRADSDAEDRPGVRWLLRGSVAGLVVLLAVMGGSFAGGAPLTGGSSMPAFIDDDDVAAMEWADAETPENAEFVVLGDAAEWFPYLSDRTILVGPWGVEWISPEAYRHHFGTHRQLSNCRDESCLSDRLRRNDIRPDYVYVPKGGYTVRSGQKHQSPEMRSSLVRSANYRLVHENRGVMIFRVNDLSNGSVSSPMDRTAPRPTRTPPPLAPYSAVPPPPR